VPSDFGKRWLRMERAGFVRTDASFDWFVNVPFIDEIFLAKGAFVLKHNCYYTNTISNIRNTTVQKLD